MKLTVFGATGRTGQEIVRQALDRGHSLTALVRDESRLAELNGALQLVHGDMLDAGAVDRLLGKPADAVISALGFFHREPSTDLSDGTRNIVDAMRRNAVRRLGVVTSLGAGDSRGQGNLLARLIQKFQLSHVLDDKERQEAVVRDSGLDYTIVRPPRLTNRVGNAGDLVVWQGDTPGAPRLTWTASRSAIAELLLDAIENGRYVKCAINVSEKK